MYFGPGYWGRGYFGPGYWGGGDGGGSPITTWGNPPRRKRPDFDDDADIIEIVRISLQQAGEIE